MKNFKTRLKSGFNKMFRRANSDQRGQGMTEYALLLLVIVALVAVFKDKIRTAVEGKLGDVATSITDFKGE